ncbi:tRNA dihydrouridine synthase [Thermosulfurimonas marina]|uniref:tRNA dihydrouridine synthase n=1 Tax=Thermosulfurimonas marina TaxID=2047767 RepID=UPI001B30D3BE|nr:tRNA-dihydrouridine synthase family protein [Thermosulfurimonas marina]
MAFQTGEVILAPLAGYTHSPFRRLLRRLGADRTWTELVSAEMILQKGLEDPLCYFTEAERPLVFQLFGADPEKIFRAAERVARELRPDALDLNAGCPVRKVVSRGAGAALLKDPERLAACAQALAEAARRAGLPASVKMRLGWDKDRLEELVERLLHTGISALVLHARLAVEGFSGQARWPRLRDLVQLAAPEGLFVIGNGDIKAPEDIKRMFKETGCQAVMVGRAALRNPWIFKEYKENRLLEKPPSLRARLALELLEEMFQVFRPETACKKIKGLLAQLFKGLPGKKALLAPLLTAENCSSLIKGLQNIAGGQ